MTRTLALAAVVCMVLGGSAFADRKRGRGHGKRNAPGGVVVRDHRGPARVSHVRVNNGRYVFPGGVVRVYKRPKHRRYYDVRVRPAVIVEAYDPVPGYLWVAGNWSWGGAEWVWTPGYWAVAAEPAPAPVISGGISVNAGITIR